MVFGISPKDNTNVLVIGTESSQKKFAKILFPDEEIKFEMPKKFNNMNFFICNDYLEKSEIISEYISKSCVTNISGRHKFHTIFATVDVEQDIEKVHSEMEQLVNFICDNKQPFIQIVIVGCAESADNIDFNALTNYTVTIERYNTANGWGKDHNKRFNGTGQFLSFFSLYKDSKDTIPEFIAKVEEDYDYYKKEESNSRASVSCDFVKNHSCVIIVGSVSVIVIGIGCLAMFCKDGIVEGKHFNVYNRIHCFSAKSS